MTTAAESTGAVGVSNQLASLVPSFDPSKDDMVQYQQRVELVMAAWHKTKITELVTRLILNCQGSAFAKLQLHQSELLTGEESSVKRLIEILGGQWGKNPFGETVPGGGGNHFPIPYSEQMSRMTVFWQGQTSCGANFWLEN